MRVLGIDPGSRVTGYGVIESDGDRLRHIDSGCLRLGGDALWQRLKLLYGGLTAVIETHSPDVAAVEKVFVSKNAWSALILGQARGSAICAAVNQDLPVFEYAARQVKSAVAGTGGADKVQIQHMVRVLLSLTVTPAVDAADALACAICHVHFAEYAQRSALAAGVTVT